MLIDIKFDEVVRMFINAYWTPKTTPGQWLDFAEALICLYERYGLKP